MLILSFLFGSGFCTTLILNSQDYSDIISAAAYAKYNNYSYVFALTPNQSVFLSRYYTLDADEPIVYLEGDKPILANMKALLQSSPVKNLNAYSPPNIQFWIADQLSSDQAILVGKQYGQDALSVSSYAALTGSPIFYLDQYGDSDALISGIISRGYSKVILYGPISEQLSPAQLNLIPQRQIIDTGNRYSNNLEITRMFLQKQPSEQVMFVSGHAFEKSMVDLKFPLLLAGRSDIPVQLNNFVSQNSIKTGIVFSGDGDIVDGVNRLKGQNPQMSFFVKFGEGYRGTTQPLPLVIISLPSPQISLEVVNLTYNVPAKLFELRIKNTGDFAAVSAGASISGVGSAQSSQIIMDSGSTTTLSIPLDASAAIDSGKIPSVDVTISYGEDTALMDNIDSITFTEVQTSFYEDTSEVNLTGVTYSSSEKSFIVTFEGQGWVSGTLGFNINNRPVVLRIPITNVDGTTQVKIKHLLSSDEESFIRGIAANYFVRSGQKEDILINEIRGQRQIEVIRVASSPSQTNSILGLDSIYIFAIAILIIGAILVFKFFAGDGGDSFA